jgi:hypothetical protein
MTSTRPVPPLPQPQQPAAAARALADAAQAAARAWAQPLDPARHQRAVSQLYSALRDLGIAARGLAAWQAPGTPPGQASREFARHVTAGARRLLDAWNCLDGVLAFEGLSPLPDPGEPGAALCHAARNVIPAWRQPTGTSADRDTTIRHVITATDYVSAATLGLATYAPRRTAINLQAALASLAGATADLSAAAEETAAGPARDNGTGRPLPGNRRPDAREVS